MRVSVKVKERILTIVVILIAIFFARSSLTWKFNEGMNVMHKYAYRTSLEAHMDDHSLRRAIEYADSSSLGAEILYAFMRFGVSLGIFFLAIRVGRKYSDDLILRIIEKEAYVKYKASKK